MTYGRSTLPYQSAHPIFRIPCHLRGGMRKHRNARGGNIVPLTARIGQINPRTLRREHKHLTLFNCHSRLRQIVNETFQEAKQNK